MKNSPFFEYYLEQSKIHPVDLSSDVKLAYDLIKDRRNFYQAEQLYQNIRRVRLSEEIDTQPLDRESEIMFKKLNKKLNMWRLK